MRIELPPVTHYPSKVYLWLCKLRAKGVAFLWIGENIMILDDIDADQAFEIN